MTRQRVAAYQMYSNSPNISENTDRVLQGIRQAANQNISILSFPECALTPFFALENSSAFDRYFVSADSAFVQRICDECRQTGMGIILPIAESHNGNFYNSTLFIDEGQIVACYRKVHLPGAFIGDTLKNFEKAYFAPGDCGFPVVTMKGIKVGVQICYDRHFPEGYRALALKGAELVFNVTAAGTYGKPWRADTWELLIRARAFENNLFVFGVNKHGPEYDQIYFGDSMLVSPLGGAVIARADNLDTDELVSAEIDTADILQAYKRLPWRRDLRPELYRDMYTAP
jgi:predicted amidohydrolase